MTRNDAIKKGQAAVIAYRRSNFADLDNAEIAEDNFLESIKIDSAAMSHLLNITSPGSAEKEMSDLFYSGIESVSNGTTILASNYSKARDQNLEERRETLMNVGPALNYLAKGYNLIVISLSNLKEYIRENDLEETLIISTSFKYFETERNKLKSFLKD